MGIVNSYFKPFTPMEALLNQGKFNALMIGLDCAGKTTILYKLNVGEIIASVPTIGFNCETLEFKKVKITCWDVGGCDRIRTLFSNYYKEIQAIIFVVDSSDKQRIKDVCHELQKILQEDYLKDAPLLILANKKEIAAMSISQIQEKLQFSAIKRVKKIQGVCAVSGDGLYEAIEWLVSLFPKNK